LDGCRNSSESPSSRRDPRDGGGGENPYKGGDKNHNDGNKKDFHTRDKRSHDEYAEANQQEQDSYNGAEEDNAFDPEEGRHHHNTRLTGQAYYIPPWGQQQAVTPNARGIQPIARAAPPTLSPAATTAAYSGIDKMLAREGIRQEKTKTVAELKWQSKIAKDKGKIKKFLDNVLQVRGFHAFLFMIKESCFVRMAHSVAKFATVNLIAGEVDGKIFVFIGNRLIDQEPCAVLIPTNAWMAWANNKVGGNTKAITDHYSDKANYGKLYQEPGGRAMKHVPNILAIPLSTVRLFKLHKQGKMPHECLEILINHINDPTMVDDKDE
jgi:hypothetical protein